MDNIIKESLTGFEDVWQRVTGRDTPQPPESAYSQEDSLLLLIHEEICAAAGATALARMFQGDGRALLLRHAADAKRHLRRLRAEYFITTGLTAASNGDCRAVGGKLASLRDAFLAAGQLAGRYEMAAGQTDCPELAEAFGAFAADERRRAQELRALLIDSF